MTERDRFPTEWSLPVQSSTGPDQERLDQRGEVPQSEDDSKTQPSKELVPAPSRDIGHIAMEVQPPAPYAYLGGEEYLG